MRHSGSGAAAAAFALVLVAAPATAQQAQVIRLGDAALDCSQIAGEADQLTAALGGAPADGVFSGEQAINAATAAATQTALLSGAGRAIPGVGLLGNALGAAARRDRERREAEAVTARQRWFYLSGLYTGRACDRAPAAIPTGTTPAEAPAAGGD